MSTPKSPSYDALKRRLEAAESALKAIREGRVDTIGGDRETLAGRLVEAEARLQATHSLLETVLDQSPFPMWIGDAEGTLIRANQALREALNLTDEQLVGRYNPLRDPNVVREGLTATIRAVIEQHKPARFTMLWRPVEYGGEGCEGGRDRHIDLAMYPIVRDGQLRNVVTQWQDITERKAAEEVLRESEKRLHLAMESASEGIWEWDFTTGLVTFDDVLLRMVGYEPDFPPQPGEWWFAQVHAEDRPAVEEAFSALMAGETETYGTEFRIAAKAGGYVWVASNARIVRTDEHGNPLLAVGIYRDITARKLAEGKLKSIEWMLTKKPSASDTKDQDYGDLTALNRDGLILRSIGKDTLRGICSDFLRLLETSAAIYEKNGDYAYGIFSSGWCRLMDGASRALCRTGDNSAALASGKWLCHESCWTNCSRRAIDAKGPVDIQCHGGIHIYSVPVFSAGEVIGAINFGYGDPPRDADTLKSLADSYGVDPEALAREAAAYESRPAFIVELAKQQLLSSARLIGAMVERRCSEDALRESEDFLNRTGAMAQVGGWEVDLDTKRVIWTQTTGRIHELPDGYFPDLEEAIGYYHPEDQAHVRQCVQCAIENGEPFDFTVRLITANGRERWVHALGQPVCDTGRCVRLTGTFQDVTERKLAERALEASEARYARLAANIPGVVFQNLQHSDDATNDEFPYISPGIHDLFGLTPDQVMRDSSAIWALIHPGDAAELTGSIQHAVETGADWNHDFRISTTDGKTKWVHGMASHERQPDGGIFWDGLLLDITERELAREALQQSERVMRYIIKHDPNALAVYDTELRYIAVSDRFLKDYGVAEADILGKHHYEVFPEMPQRWKEVHQRVLAGATERDDDDCFERPDGSITYNRWECRPWYQADGSIGGMITYTEVTTERKLAETALRESEERYRRYIESSPNGVFVCDDTGRYLEVNPAASLITGYSQDELTAMCIADLLFEDDRDAGIRHFETLVREGTSYGELPYRHKNGERRWWSVSAVRLPDNRFLGFCTDVTEHRGAEQALRYSENLFRRVFELLPVGLWIADKQGTLLQGNPAGVRIWGAEPHVPQEEYGVFKARRLPSGEKIAPDDWALAHTVKEGITIVDELLEIDAFDGVKRVILNYTAPVKDETGNMLAAVVVNRDITDQYRAEEALQESERKYRLLADNTLDVIWLMDMDLRFVYVNPAILALTGYTVSEWVRTRLPDHCDEEAFGRMAAAIEAEVAKGPQRKGTVFESEMRRKNGTSLPVEIHGKVIFGDTGAPRFLQGVTRDITERKQADKRLRQMAKMEAVGRLAGGVAHDFNNMLGIIIGHADMILDEMKPGQPFYDDLMEIRQAGARSADLTRQLLAFARKQTVAPKVIDVDKTVDGMLKMLQRLIGENIDMAWVPGGNVWPVKIDPAQIDQVLANLCVNARDAIAGVGKVTIETGNAVFDQDYCRDHAGYAPGEYAMLAVSDNGCGMDAETLSHLFEPFFSTKDLGKGTGLGLATVYGVVKQNSGFINVYSEPGHGTTFKIYLPRHKAKTTPLPEKGPDKPSERGHETVLLVEDEPAILRMTATMLERQGYKVVGASTPGEAVRLATEHAGAIHLLMTDVVMPEMNGRALAKNILSLYPGLKCLFMSGYTANVIAHHGVLDEGVNFIQKPFSKEELTVKVREVLDRN